MRASRTSPFQPSKGRSSPVVTQDSRGDTVSGWKFPIRVNPHGGLSFSSGEQKVQESIWLILATAHKERQMLPKFGCGIHGAVFASNSAATRAALSQSVRQALSRFEPRIDVLDVRVEHLLSPKEAERALFRRVPGARLLTMWSARVPGGPR